MAKVYIVYAVIDFVRDYGNLIESFEITSSKQIEYDNWHGATYLTKVKFNMANGLSYSENTRRKLASRNTLDLTQ